MQTISIHVPPALAKTYENANEEKKQRAEQFINAWLESFLGSKTPDDRMFDLMKQATANAKKNGLTPEKLEELIKDEE
jgi:hypothetical protein